MGLVAPTPILNLPVAVGIDNTFWVPGASTATNQTTRINVQTLTGIQGSLNSITTTQGAILFRGLEVWEGLDPGTSGYVLSTQGPGADPQWIPGTTGSVTSVGLSLPVSLFSVSGSPVTSSGTLTGDLIAQNANKVFAGPVTGADAVPTFRSLVNADISGTGAALTKTDDTNVTATLSGSPTTALVNAANIALGWTGHLGLSRGGTNADLSATGGTSQVLRQSSAGAAITVSQLAASDIGSGQALTRTNDTNITLSLGGSPTSSLLAATSLTLGWTGTLAVSRGGLGVGTQTSHGVLLGQGISAVTAVSPGTSGYALMANGASSDPTYQAFVQGGTSPSSRTWLAKAQEWVTPYDFGAVGNGSTDDTTALQNAVDYCVSSKKALYLFGSFKISSAINITGGITIYGSGWASSEIIMSTLTQNGLVLNDTNFAGIHLYNFQIRGQFSGSVSTHTAGAAIYVTSTTNISQFSTFRDLRIAFPFTGIHFDATQVWTVDSCYILGVALNGFGIIIENSGAPSNGEIQISNTWVQGSITTPGAGTGIGIYHKSAVNVKVTNSEIFQWVTGYLVTPNVASGLAGVFINNTVFSQLTNAVSFIKGATGTTFTIATITNNEIIAVNGVTVSNDVGWMSNLVVANNYFEPGIDVDNGSATAGTGIFLPAVTRFSLTGNTFGSAGNSSNAIIIGSSATNGVVVGNTIASGVNAISNSSPSTYVSQFVLGSTTATFSGASSGYSFDAKIFPATNDGAALGDTTHNFSDLFLATGGVINWNNGGITITEASDGLNFAGATAAYAFDFNVSVTKAQSASTSLVINNQSTNAAAASVFQATTDAGSVFLKMNSTGGSSLGQFICNGAGGFYFDATHSTGGVLRFRTGSSPTQALDIDVNQNVRVGTGALATTATNGFLYIDTCAGSPTGTPTSKTGAVPIIYDTTNNKLYAYNGAWKGVTLA